MFNGRNGRSGIIAVLCVNALLVCAIVGLFRFYSSGYQDSIREQNLADITNINRSSANISSIYFSNGEGRLSDIAQYVTGRGLTVDEALSYICDSNTGDMSFELVGTDAKGYAAIRTDGGFEPVDYTSKTYTSFASVFTASDTEATDEVACTQEFTDKITASRSFALYARLTLADANGTVTPYTLLGVTKSSDIADMIALDGGYDDMSTVLMNQRGDYLFGSTDFKSDNLFSYFYVFNELSLDQKQELVADFASDGGDGTYYYKDSKGRDCVFVCTEVPDTQWYCVSCVPLSSFHDYSFGQVRTFWIAGLLLAMMCVDISWLVYSNRKLKASARREREASSAKTDFLSRMSHDIRTPLNVIIGSAILARDEPNPPVTQAHLDDIDRSGKFLLSLINDILDLDKVESGKMELYPGPYSLSQFHANIASIIEPLCVEKGIRFVMTGDDDDTPYMLDSVRFNQVFFNLLSNSVKFTDPGGRITLDCRAIPRTEGAALNIVVTDDGQGMSEEFQRRMFDSFTQEHDSDTARMQGTGLGLAIVKNLVDLMGGTISVESALGQGTSFHVSIPAVIASGEPVGEATVSSESASIVGRHILLFEDNEINARIARALLERRGAIVDHASDGLGGLAMFSQSEPFHYDAILMDLRMPEMNGYEATHAIRGLERADASSVPIIAMTANAYEEDVRRCLDAGMNAHLSKPIDPDALMSVLAKQIDLS